MTDFLFGQSRVVYQWLKIEQLDQWWHWLALVAVCVLVLSYVLYWYRRDTLEQFRPVGWTLMALRIAALVGLLLYFFQLEKRTEQRVVRDSRLAVLVDTSLSMSLPGTPSSVGLSSQLSRTEEATQIVGQSSLLQELSQDHQLSVYRFGQSNRPASLAALNKQDAADQSLSDNASDQQGSTNDLQTTRQWVWISLGMLGVGILLLSIALGAQALGLKEWYQGSWLLLFGASLCLAALMLGGFAIVPNSQYSLATFFNQSPPVSPAEDEPQTEEETSAVVLPDDWAEALAPRGTETRLGDAIKFVLDREVSNPLAGIVIFTDGRNNQGLDPRQALTLAQVRRIPLYFVGLGSSENPKNLEVVEVDVPKRLYPGDRFTLKALVAGNGYGGQSVDLQVLVGPKDADPASMAIESEMSVEIPADGSLATAEFQLEPKTIGQWQYVVQVIANSQDAVEDDNSKTAAVEVLERKNRVLIFAGGPMRDYQFVRNLLYRDRNVESHVLLQTGSASSSQEAQELLTEFPSSLSDLSQYDAILAFDPDWTRVPETSIRALERWVSEQAGGLLMVAGSVEMPKWLTRSASGNRARYLRSLSPVVLERRGSAMLAGGRVEGKSAWPLDLTVDGSQSEFLWLTDDAQSSIELWEDFEGVYSFFAAYELKPGAKALLHFSDPTASVDGQLPIYMANQYYGAGRTIFIGGGELWRLRSFGDEYFDRLYTKLVRWVSQSRLLLDSDRGVLLVDREQAVLGDQVVVRAVLKNEQFEPLIQSEVVARRIDPDGLNTPLVLRPLADGSQPGVYTGQFPVLKAGEYGVQLQIGGLASDEILSANVKARVPALEMQRAERHDVLLRQLATESGGLFWTGVENAMRGIPDSKIPESLSIDASELDSQGNEALSLANIVQPQDQVAYLPGTPDQVFELRWLGWLMAWIAGCLTLEWLTRRMHRLA